MSNGAITFQRRENAVLCVVVVIGGKIRKNIKYFFMAICHFMQAFKTTTRGDGDGEEFHWKREN